MKNLVKEHGLYALGNGDNWIFHFFFFFNFKDKANYKEK